MASLLAIFPRENHAMEASCEGVRGVVGSLAYVRKSLVAFSEPKFAIRKPEKGFSVAGGEACRRAEGRYGRTVGSSIGSA